MKKSDIKIGMKVVPFKKSLTYDCGILVSKGAKKNLEKSALWSSAKKSKKPFLYVKQFDCEDDVEFVHLGTTRGRRGGADFFLPRDFRPYESK